MTAQSFVFPPGGYFDESDFCFTTIPEHPAVTDVPFKNEKRAAMNRASAARSRARRKIEREAVAQRNDCLREMNEILTKENAILKSQMKMMEDQLLSHQLCFEPGHVCRFAPQSSQ